LAPDEPLTKAKYLRQATCAAAKLDESTNATASSPNSSSRKVLYIAYFYKETCSDFIIKFWQTMMVCRYQARHTNHASLTVKNPRA
jgi:hypothetical protein